MKNKYINIFVCNYGTVLSPMEHLNDYIFRYSQPDSITLNISIKKLLYYTTYYYEYVIKCYSILKNVLTVAKS